MNNAHDDPAVSASSADTWLEDLLVTEGASLRAAHIDDAGFAARVVEALPPPATAPAWRRAFVTGLWGAAAIAMVIAMPSLLVEMLREAHRLLSAQPFSLAGAGVALITLVTLTWGAAAWTLREHD